MISTQNKARFKDLFFQKRKLLEYIRLQKPGDREVLLKALELAKKSHGDQQRDEGGLYIIHPIRCALALIQEFGIDDPELVAALLLHDVAEDTPVTLEVLRKDFSERIVDLVNNLTRPRPPDEKEEDKFRNKQEAFQKLIGADYETRLLKCMDLLDNYRSWRIIPETELMQKKIKRWALEAEQFAIPLAEKTDQRVAKALRKAVANYKKHLL